MTDVVRVPVVETVVVRVPTGQPGTPGASAYDVAVANGFVGTVEEWLGSLQGETGTAGPAAVSADDGNVAILGSDDLIYVPEPSGGGAVDSVAGKTGVVVLEKADVGLGNVDNTADADKPVSTATATALSGKSDTGHTHAQSDVTGLIAALDAKADDAAVTTALADKSDTGHTHAQSDVTGLTAALDGKSDTGHTHTASNVTDFDTAADARVAAGIIVAGTANNPHTSAAATRNSALPKNFWQTATEPDNWVDGDEWIQP
jgi:hypothetical protein